MGIPWDEEECGNDCGCYPPGRTPKHLYASFSGIRKCHPESPWPSPPSGVFQITQDPGDPCYWWCEGGSYRIMYYAAHPTAYLLAWAFGAADYPFAGSSDKPCTKTFSVVDDCDPLNPLITYGGGTGIVMATANQPFVSLQTIADLIGFVQDKESMCDFMPIDQNKIWLCFARKKTPTNILIKFDFSEYDQYDMFEWD